MALLESPLATRSKGVRPLEPAALGVYKPMFFSNFYSSFWLFFWQTLRGSFSAVSKPNFASKYSLEFTRSTRFTRFCTFGIQLKNHEKRFWQASSGRSTRPRKRSSQTAAAMPGEVAKRGCTLACCSNSGSRDCADSKDKACDARHGARMVQIATCFANTNKNCKIFAPLRIQKSG